MAVITIDDKQYTVEAGQNLLQVCLSAGIDLPYFCWHPALGSVGACRQCAAKQFADENDQRGRLVTACMTPVQDGNIFSVKDQQAEKFRATVIESLMTNHPHDCPVCEEGGECHLQDMTEMSSHTTRRYRGKKRTHNNQNLGPLINHEMNRCISCYRCVRFYNDYAGGKDLAAFASHNHVYFGREKDGVLENEFAGNLIEVCPTGVFTDKTFSAHYARKWDLQTAPGICNHCAVGCNTIPGSRYDSVRRIVNRYHSDINGYFLCDRGRFGYGYNNHPERLMTVQHGDSELPVGDLSVDESAGLARLVAAGYEAASGSAYVVGIGSPRASLENNYALREFVGADNYQLGVSAADYASHTQLAQIAASHGLNLASVKDAENADVIVLLGEDIAETAPRMSLALRQAIRNKGKDMAAEIGIADWQDAAVRRYCPDETTPLFIASLTSTRLDDIAEQALHIEPGEIAQLGCYIADRIAGKATEITVNETQQQWAQQLIDALAGAQRPLIISGSGYQQPLLLEASINLFNAVKANQPQASYYYVLPEANSMGAALLAVETNKQTMSALPERLLAAKKQGQRTVMLVLENDLYRRMGSASVDQLLTQVDELIVLDHFHHGTTQKADWCLPVTTALESQGTLVNAEGRAQRYYSVIQPTGPKHSWRWLVDAAAKTLTLTDSSNLGKVASWQHCDDISLDIANAVTAFTAIRDLIADSHTKLARQSHRYSGRTAMNANLQVAEKKPLQDQDSPFAYSMEGISAHGPLENSVWSPGWNSNQAIHKFQGGESGLKLFSYNADIPLPYFQSPLQSPLQQHSISSTDWQLFPVQHVFGSEELSARAEAIAELSPDPCVLLNTGDAEKLQVKEWDTLRCSVAGQQQQFYLRIDNAIPAGIAAVLQTDQAVLGSHWPVSAELIKDTSPLPKPMAMIATDQESAYVR